MTPGLGSIFSILNATATAGAAAHLGYPGGEPPQPNPAVTLRIERAAFLSPDAAVACYIDEGGVTCEGPTRMLLQDDVERLAGGEAVRDRARLGEPDAEFVTEAGDARQDVEVDGQAYAGLRHGVALENATFRVAVNAIGVTATNKRTGRGFTMSAEGVTVL